MGRYFRIHVMKESADEGSVVVSRREPPHEKWDCGCCGEYERNEDRSHCFICSQERGTWRCERCDHLNPPKTRKCQECGVAKPDA